MVVALTVPVAGCASHRGRSDTSEDAGQATRGDPLQVRIVLDQTSVPAGTPITGEAIVVNSSARPLLISATCNHSWLQVGLSSPAIPWSAVWRLCRDLHGTTLPAGTTRIPL
ncbi:MAG: hypothetical protein QOH57_1672, partial [Mycobacterium sp.]|nr:hypothetical protein [Mycobacterium sp.]